MAVFEDTLTDAVTALPLMNAKAPSDPFQLALESTRVESSSNTEALIVPTAIPSGLTAKYLPLLIISSRYSVTSLPGGWVSRVSVNATGSTGTRYLRVLELPKTLFSVYANGSAYIPQAGSGSMCAVYCLFSVGEDGYIEYVASSTATTSSAVTDVATPPSLTATNEREAYIICMTASPHPTSGTASAPAGSTLASPNTTYPVSATNNVAVAYYTPSIRSGQSNSGDLGLNASAVNTSGVALLSATLRYVSRGYAVQDTPTTTDAGIARVKYARTLSDQATISPSPRWGWAMYATSAATFAANLEFTLAKSATATAVAQFLDAQALKYTYRPVMIETPQIVDSQLVTWPRAVSESLGVAPSVVAARALRVIEALRLTETVAPVLFYKLTVSEALLARDLLARFVSGDVIEGLGVSASLAGIRRFAPAVAEALGLSETVSRKVVLRLVSTESMNLTSAQALKLLFKPTIDEAVELTLAYIAPNESITTWAVNTRTGAASEYTGFNFNSFAEMGRSYLAASSSGLYELKGNTDDTADIIAKIKTGLASLGDGRHVMFKAVYLGMRGSDEFYFKVDAGDGREYVYKIAVQDMETTKVRLGKGLRARYFAFELESLGQDFDLESVEFVPVLSSRHR